MERKEQAYPETGDEIRLGPEQPSLEARKIEVEEAFIKISLDVTDVYLNFPDVRREAPLILVGSYLSLAKEVLNRAQRAGMSVLPKPVKETSLEGFGFTERELELLVLLGQGAPTKDLAKNLSITEQTVKFHLTKVYSKLRVTNRSEALIRARELGIYKPEVEEQELRDKEKELQFLTIKERQVLERIGQGLRNQEVAAGLEVSVQTVKYHLTNIYRKIGVKNRVEAADWWSRLEHLPHHAPIALQRLSEALSQSIEELSKAKIQYEKLDLQNGTHFE